MAKRRKYHQHIQKTRKHFSNWMGIAHGGKSRTHKAGCCDCGLIHDQQYRVLMPVMKNGKKKVFQVDLRKVEIQIRVRVNHRATAARRRAKQKFRKR